jgi:hypothetical protein
MPIRKNALIFLITMLLFGLVLVFSFLVHKNENKNLEKSADLEISSLDKTYPENLTGKVYLTLMEKTNQKVGVYAFDLDKNKLEAVNVPKGNCHLLGGEVSVEENRMLVTSDCNNSEDKIHQLRWLDLKSKTIGAQITKKETHYKREGSRLLNGEGVVFMAYEEEGEEVNLVANDWNIYKVDSNGKESFITNAIHPFVSPDGKKFLALRTRGLYLFDVGTGEGQLVSDLNFGVSMTTQMDLSDDGKLLAISNSGESEIIIFNIDNWEDFSLVEKSRITEASISWPKFSMKNKGYLVAEEALLGGEINLVVYNLETKEKYSIADLTDYEHNYMWVNDWK